MIGGPTKNSSGNPKALELPSTPTIAGAFRPAMRILINLLKMKALNLEKIGDRDRPGGQ
jgi:hypothetical protein